MQTLIVTIMKASSHFSQFRFRDFEHRKGDSVRRTLSSAVQFLIFASIVTVGSIGGSAVRVAAQAAVPETRTSKPKLMISPRNLNLGKKVGEAATGQFTMSAENGTFTITVNPPSGKKRGSLSHRIGRRQLHAPTGSSRDGSYSL
jgi:hypothetical protein